MERTIVNTATGEKVTYLETSRETGGARSRFEMEAKPGGGVPLHRHAHHDELIEVLDGEIEVTMNGVKRRLGPGERVLIERGTTHRWCNPSPDRDLKFRGGMTPGHPDFELFLRVYYGLGRDGAVVAMQPKPERGVQARIPASARRRVQACRITRVPAWAA